LLLKNAVALEQQRNRVKPEPTPRAESQAGRRRQSTSWAEHMVSSERDYRLQGHYEEFNRMVREKLWAN
jgi:hypothetical protein